GGSETVFAALTVAGKVAGDRLAKDLRTEPKLVLQALEAITETVVHYMAAVMEAGADGVFFATQTGSADVVSQDEKMQFGLLYARRVLDSLSGKSSFTLLHLHGKQIYFDELTSSLPVHAVNWHDRLTNPSLGDAQEKFAGAVAGGLDEGHTLRTGPVADIAAQVADAVRQTGGVGLIVTPGCVLPLDVPDEHLQAVVDAVRGQTSHF